MNAATTKGQTKGQTKTAFASVFDALAACGITQKPNMAGHIKAGRITKTGNMTKVGITYFANRLPDEQSNLKAMMIKAGKSGFKTGSGFVFAPVENGPVSHAPINPGSYSASIIRAWFSVLVSSVKA